MSDEIAKQEPLSAIQALRALMTLDTDDGLAIVKTGVKDGVRGLVARGLSVLQMWDEGRFCSAFVHELEDMREAGRILEDFNGTDAGVSSLREFFELIDGKPDEERFRAFCALFMSANAPDADANEAFLDLELMSILRKLSAGEMRVLSAFLKVREYTVGQGYVVSAVLAKEIGNTPQALIGRNAAALVQQSLVVQTWNDMSGTGGLHKPLLTDLGVELMSRIEKYNEFKEGRAATASTSH
jgi:hypothetical protein